MGRKLRVGILYGGRSGEHEISLRSANAVIRALDPARYDVIPIAITKRGRWFVGPDSLKRLDRAQERLRPITAHGEEVAILPEPTRQGLVQLERRTFSPQRLDVVFPVLHGSYGEDGVIQGLLELAGLPYVGAGVLGSAVGMDKDVMKRLLRDAGLPVVRFFTLRGSAATDAVAVADHVEKARLGYPCFVKPANLGSSVGISKVSGAAGLSKALRTAMRYDTKVVVEEAVVGREFEIALIGSVDARGGVQVSVPGEVIPGREFYDYVDKYVANRARTVVPARMAPDSQVEMTTLARRAYEALECDGMARVDFFMRQGDNKLLVNEINTIPGITPISLFPQMWQASGVSFPVVVERLITLALERHRRRQALSTSFTVDRGGERATSRRIPRRPSVRAGRRQAR